MLIIGAKGKDAASPINISDKKWRGVGFIRRKRVVIALKSLPYFGK
jgi:hypothetical protein